MKVLAAILIAFALAGCGSNEKDRTITNSDKHPVSSTAKDAIEGFTGKTQVKHGNDAMQKIRNISADQKQQLDEALNTK